MLSVKVGCLILTTAIFGYECQAEKIYANDLTNNLEGIFSCLKRKIPFLDYFLVKVDDFISIVNRIINLDQKIIDWYYHIESSASILNDSYCNAIKMKFILRFNSFELYLQVGNNEGKIY